MNRSCILDLFYSWLNQSSSHCLNSQLCKERLANVIHTYAYNNYWNNDEPVLRNVHCSTSGRHTRSLNEQRTITGSSSITFRCPALATCRREYYKMWEQAQQPSFCEEGSLIHSLTEKMVVDWFSNLILFWKRLYLHIYDLLNDTEKFFVEFMYTFGSVYFFNKW